MNMPWSASNRTTLFWSAVRGLVNILFFGEICFAEIQGSFMALIVGTWMIAMNYSVIPVEFIQSMSKVTYPFWIGVSLLIIGIYQVTALVTRRLSWRRYGATMSAGAWFALFYLTIRQDYISIVTPCSLAFAVASLWAEFPLYVMVPSESGTKTYCNYTQHHLWDRRRDRIK